jgi:hypothetical protein
LLPGVTDMRRGFDGLSAQVQTVLEQQPFSGHVFLFRGPPRGHRQASLVRRRRPLSVRQAPGEGPLYLATSYGRDGFPDPCAAFDAAGRHRLAVPEENLDA